MVVLLQIIIVNLAKADNLSILSQSNSTVLRRTFERQLTESLPLSTASNSCCSFASIV